MKIEISDVELYKPYRLAFMQREDDAGFLMFLNKDSKPLVLEHNPRIDSVSVHRWHRHLSKNETLDLIRYKDLRYVIRKIFDARSRHYDEI